MSSAGVKSEFKLELRAINLFAAAHSQRKEHSVHRLSVGSLFSFTSLRLVTPSQACHWSDGGPVDLFTFLIGYLRGCSFLNSRACLTCDGTRFPEASTQHSRCLAAPSPSHLPCGIRISLRWLAPTPSLPSTRSPLTRPLASIHLRRASVSMRCPDTIPASTSRLLPSHLMNYTAALEERPSSGQVTEPTTPERKTTLLASSNIWSRHSALQGSAEPLTVTSPPGYPHSRHALAPAIQCACDGVCGGLGDGWGQAGL